MIKYNNFTPAELRNLADRTNTVRVTVFWTAIKECVDDNIKAIEQLLLKAAADGKYELDYPVDARNHKYYENLEGFDSAEFIDEVIKELENCYLSRDFVFLNTQNNHIRLRW